MLADAITRIDDVRLRWKTSERSHFVIIQRGQESVEVGPQPARRCFAVTAEKVQGVEEVEHTLRRVLQSNGVGWIDKDKTGYLLAVI